MTTTIEPSFCVISGTQVESTLQGHERTVIEIVEAAYRLHGEGGTVNPRSYFLTFPDRPAARIIALPASLAGDAPVDGIKWISSFPDNITSGLPRASAILILNNPWTGYPLACLEASIISAARTAASAALAARHLTHTRGRPRRLGIVGLGLIARYVLSYLLADGWDFDEIHLNDLAPGQAASFAAGAARQHGIERITKVHPSAEGVIRASDLLLFATVAARPHVNEPTWFSHHPLVLHISLRDLAPEVLLDAVNFVDDVDHCLQADTSPHLTEQRTGSRGFLTGTLYDLLTGRIQPPSDETLVFSPFGLGVLDLAVARYVWHAASRAGEVLTIPGFFRELSRHG